MAKLTEAAGLGHKILSVTKTKTIDITLNLKQKRKEEFQKNVPT